MNEPASILIEYHGQLGVPMDMGMFQAVQERLTHQLAMGGKADVYTNTRSTGTGVTPAGWLEWVIVVEYRSGGGHLTIGAIQRMPNAEYEFHS